MSLQVLPATNALTLGRAMPAQQNTFQYMQHETPLPPPPVNEQVDPHMQALYQQALHAHQQLGQVRQQYVAPLANYGDGLGGFALGLSNLRQLIQGGQFNPGLTPLQGTHGTALPQPNILAPHVPQGINYNPQSAQVMY